MEAAMLPWSAWTIRLDFCNSTSLDILQSYIRKFTRWLRYALRFSSVGLWRQIAPRSLTPSRQTHPTGPGSISVVEADSRPTACPRTHNDACSGPIVGSSTHRTARATTTRTASRSRTNNASIRANHRSSPHRLPDSENAATGPPGSSSRAAQKAKAIQTIEKDSWSPADDDEVAAALQGLSLKHSIHLDYELATALRRCYSQLRVSCDRSVRLTEQARESEKRRGNANARNLPIP